ncbi:hypothetical protein GQR58_020914 [Nymphon striatum]|nr:hypothetical protein GQR58_020914 [Nymphon striatum]
MDDIAKFESNCVERSADREDWRSRRKAFAQQSCQSRTKVGPALVRKVKIPIELFCFYDVMDAARDVMDAVRDVIPVACEALLSKMLLLLWLRSIPCFNATATTREALVVEKLYMKGVRDQKIVVFSSDSQAAIQAIEGNIISSSTVLCCIQNLNLLEGWEEEEIIDKKDSAEGRTSNLPYRNSVVCNVSIPQTIANRGEPLSSKL